FFICCVFKFSFCFFFFFQAEDGIRDFHVTGVQTCALPILRYGEIPAHLHFREPNPYIPWERLPVRVVTERERWPEGAERIAGVRSEERRVGKECRCGGARAELKRMKKRV